MISGYMVATGKASLKRLLRAGMVLCPPSTSVWMICRFAFWLPGYLNMEIAMKDESPHQAAHNQHKDLKKLAVWPMMALTLAIGACSSLPEQNQTRAVPLAPAHAELIEGQSVPVTAHAQPLSLLE